MSESPDINVFVTGSAGSSGAQDPYGYLASDERWQLVQRIAASHSFHRAARMRGLLLFIAERSLTGRVNELTEFEVGHRVFGRGAKYVPIDDSIVRSSARQLRVKLGEYFQDEGRHEPLRMEIPKGGYVATFVPQTAGAVPTVEKDDELAAVPAPSAPQSRRDWLTWVLAAFALLSAGTNVWLWRRAAPSDSQDRQAGLVRYLVMRSKQAVQVVLDDFAFVLMQHDSPGRFSLEDYANRAYVAREAAPSQDPVFLSLWDLLGTRYIVSLGAQATAEKVIRSVPQTGKVVVRHARNVATRNFREGSSILLGSPTNNPWTEMFEDRLNFRFIRNRQEAAGFVNTRSRPGELPRYSVERPYINSGTGYGRVAYVPNLSGNGFVLMVTGLNMVTAEAAGDYATDGEKLSELRRLLGAAETDNLPYFEVLLETHALDNSPTQVRVIAFRRLDQ